MNVVCLLGRVYPTSATGFPARAGWTQFLMQVPRRTPRGQAEPGVFTFVVLLPPTLAQEARRGSGALVTVVGMLAVDVDRSGDTPQVHYVVVGESLQRAAVTSGTGSESESG